MSACSDMERQHVQDKDAWKKNTVAQLKETRDRMQKLSENQLETLTKRTILENEAMAAELKYQSRQVSLQPWQHVADANTGVAALQGQIIAASTCDRQHMHHSSASHEHDCGQQPLILACLATVTCKALPRHVHEVPADC